jgi:hypothetical protein
MFMVSVFVDAPLGYPYPTGDVLKPFFGNSFVLSSRPVFAVL